MFKALMELYMQQFTSQIINLFQSIPDYRGKVITYPICEVFFLFTIGIMAGCTDFEDIAEFGKLRLNELKKYMPFINGIPNQRTIARIISQTNRDSVSSILGRFFSANHKSHLALDGKHIGEGIFSVSAFDAGRCITIAHSEPFTQGHELAGIKEILKDLSLKECVISIDAIGCNREIFDIIKKQRGEAVIAVKNNNKYLYSQIKNFFEYNAQKGSDAVFCPKHTTLDKGHGRVEERNISVLHDLELLPETRSWPHIEAVAEISSSRYIKGKQTLEKRYYAMTQKYSAQEALSLIRGHWAIENNLHWVLDVNLKEDSFKSLVDNARYNIASIKRIVLNILKCIKPQKGSMIGFQRKIARDPKTMHEALSSFWLTFC